jgi:hypothetical protein
MPTNLPQKYVAVAKDVIPYQPEEPHKVGLITFEPALPCVICQHPATTAIIAPAPDKTPGAWLSFPICPACEERQIRSHMAG